MIKDKEKMERQREKSGERAARRREVGNKTITPWFGIREVLRKQGYKWTFNEATETHRRIKISLDAGRFIENHLSLLAIEQKYGVTVVVEFPPGLTYNPLLPNSAPRDRGEVKLRIYPEPRAHDR